MREKRLFITLFFTFLFLNCNAQLSTNEQPVSFGLATAISEDLRKSIQTVEMPLLDMTKIEAEDKEDEEYDMPPRFGYPHKVNFDLTNSGKWTVLPNGDKIWQLNIICPGALSVNFCYDKFWIPEGGKFFVYSKDKKHTIGAFTSRNNKGNMDDLRGFATGLVYGGDIILEYYQPKNVASDAIISIEYVVHGYRYINIEKYGYGTSGECQVNVNCSEGQDWQNEKKAVAMVLVHGTRYCTGSLINTVSLSQTPLFLTANHCISHYGDAVTNPNLDYYSFCWTYESPGCVNESFEPTGFSTSGATILANSRLSDFALLRLTEDPKTQYNYIPYYMGWDISGQSGLAGVGIHHPSGDVKKISTVAAQPISTDNYRFTGSYLETHWKVTWKATQNGHGTTEGGSSGSPLLTATHKIIGQLHSGISSCSRLDGYDKYGKISFSWTGNNNDSISRRMNCWLDSLNTGIQVMEGLLVIPSAMTINSNQKLYSNIRIINGGQLTILNDIELMGNSRIIVESNGRLVIDGGNLSNAEIVLKSGATLQILNDGIIETRSGFEAPVGAVVDIVNGQIF